MDLISQDDNVSLVKLMIGIAPPTLASYLNSTPAFSAAPTTLISPGLSLEEMMLKLKLQYSGHLMRRVDSQEKILMLGGIGVNRFQKLQVNMVESSPLHNEEAEAQTKEAVHHTTCWAGIRTGTQTSELPVHCLFTQGQRVAYGEPSVLLLVDYISPADG